MIKRRITIGAAIAATALLAGCASGPTLHRTPTKATTPQSATSVSQFPSDEPTYQATYPVDTPSTTPEHESNAKFGVPYTITGTDALGSTVSATLTIKAPVKDASFGEGYPVPKHGQMVSFYVSITSDNDGLDYNEWDFYVREASGAHDEPEIFGKDPSFNSGTLRTGEKVSGYITFDASVHGALVYAPAFSGASAGEWPY